jgi:hypothetical protein
MAYRYDTREVTHGTSYGAYAEIVESVAAPGTLDTTQVPNEFTGLRGVSFETTQESNPYYADNVEHIRLIGAKTIEGDITAYQIPKDFMTAHLGFKLASNGGLTDTGVMKNFIWQFIETVTDETGNEYRNLTVYYNVKASAPTAEAVTDEDSVEPKEFTIPCTASPNSLVKDTDGKAVSMFQVRETAENKQLIELAYNQIVLPTTAVPPAITGIAFDPTSITVAASGTATTTVKPVPTGAMLPDIITLTFSTPQTLTDTTVSYNNATRVVTVSAGTTTGTETLTGTYSLDGGSTTRTIDLEITVS